MKQHIPDLLLIAGAGLLSYGAWLVLPAAGFVVGGSLVLIQGIIMAKAVKPVQA